MERTKSPWSWVPTLYLAEGLPYVLVNNVSVVLFKELGLSNATTAWATSWFYFPWVLKPLWGPLVDVRRTKRFWILAMQLCLGGGLGAIALLIPVAGWIQGLLAAFWLVAFASATQDIAIDGLYMLGLSERDQSAFVGLRSAFYRIAMVAGQGGLVVLAGVLTHRLELRLAWSLAFALAAVVFLGFALYHRFVLPTPRDEASVGAESARQVMGRVVDVFVLFFMKPDIVRVLAFLLLFRVAEAQLIKLISPFLLDPRALGGLALSTEQVGFTYGTVGVLSITVGGVLGGWVISRHGLKAWLWPMVLATHLPDLAYVLLSWLQPENYLAVNALVGLEQFGYGFGLTAFSLYQIKISEGPYKTAHFALCTGFMALGMMVPGMVSGAVEQWLGYRMFFLWVIAFTVPGFLVAALVKVDPEFGKRRAVSG